MMVNVITFSIHNFRTSHSEEFIVENSVENQEMIFRHRFSRDIQFTQLFDFEFERKESTPKFIEFGHAVADAFIENKNVMDIDSVDEMVGMYV